MGEERCTAVAKSTGELCGQPALPGTDPPRCLFHDDRPETAEMRRLGRMKGGKKHALRLPKEAPLSLEQIRANISELIVELQSAPGTSTNIRALLDAYQLLVKLTELDEFDQRLKALEVGD